MNHLAILGASGHGKVIADCAESAGWLAIDFYDDAWPLYNKSSAWSVIGDTQVLIANLGNYDGVIVAIGNNVIRLEKQLELVSYNAPLVNIIHPSAQISRYVELGSGCVIMPGVIINVDSKLGNACIVNTGASIDHDCLLGDAVHICPGVHLAGGVNIGDYSWIGIGANIIQLIKIGPSSIIGAGSVVIKNIKGHCTVAGVPARLIDSPKQKK
ncbi:MAG: acetyltransferase [Pseudomonadota bacterium]